MINSTRRQFLQWGASVSLGALLMVKFQFLRRLKSLVASKEFPIQKICSLQEIYHKKIVEFEYLHQDLGRKYLVYLPQAHSHGVGPEMRIVAFCSQKKKLVKSQRLSQVPKLQLMVKNKLVYVIGLSDQT